MWQESRLPLSQGVHVRSWAEPAAGAQSAANDAHTARTQENRARARIVVEGRGPAEPAHAARLRHEQVKLSAASVVSRQIAMQTTASQRIAVAGLALIAFANCGSPLDVNDPHFGPTQSQAIAPPPVSGGTLLVTRDGARAVVSDPDRDRVYVVDLASRARIADLSVAGGEPGRLVEGADGVVYAVLRGADAVQIIDARRGASIATRPVCAAPRGIAFDQQNGWLHVACAGGELRSIDTATWSVARTITVARDLRDVVIDGDGLIVSSFRSAEVRRVSADGTVSAPSAPARFDQSQQRITSTSTGDRTTIEQRFEPNVAWRLVARPGGGAALLHQRAQVTSVTPPMSAATGGYYGTTTVCASCSCSVVHATVTEVGREGPAPLVPMATLAVDLAYSPDGSKVAIVSAANYTVPLYPSLLLLPTSSLAPGRECASDRLAVAQPTGQTVAVAFAPTGVLLAQTREPAALFFADTGASVALSSESRHDTGHEVFHSNSGAFIACASCHPEGTDDGHVWNFSATEIRRTQNLRGGIIASAPYHWAGDLPTMNALASRVFMGRMSGPRLATPQIAALERWIDRQPLPAPARAVMDDAATRGRSLFTSARGGCLECHSGERFTSNETVSLRDVRLQVPSLRGVAWRAPYRFDGCAKTLEERFTRCGDERHGGGTNTFAANELRDLVAFLETL